MATVEEHAAAADAAREQVAASIDAVQDYLNPRRIMDRAVTNLTSQTDAVARKAGSAIRSHPVALGAAVAAIALALVARSRIKGATLDLDHDMDGYTDYDDGMDGDLATRLYDDEADDDDTGASAVQRLGGSARAAVGKAGAAVEDSPLLSVMAGLAAGAALAMLFPPTDAEKQAARSVLGS